MDWGEGEVERTQVKEAEIAEVYQILGTLKATLAPRQAADTATSKETGSQTIKGHRILGPSNIIKRTDSGSKATLQIKP